MSSTVIWYYSVGGKVSPPSTWEDICKAVDEKRLGPDDLVWTSAFGKEWRKVSTLEALSAKFHAVSDPINPNDKEVSLTQEEQIAEVSVNPSAEDDSSSHQEEEINLARSRIGIRLGLKRAYYGMIGILFASPFNIMRWIPLAVALFLATQMSTKFVINATSVLLSSDGEVAAKLRDNSEQIGLNEEFYTSGVFSEQWKNEYLGLNEFIKSGNHSNLTQQELEQKLVAIYSRLINGVGESCLFIWNWIKTFNGIIVSATVFLMAFIMKLALFWFGSRGKFIAMARCYAPAEPFGVTWRRVAASSNRFFKLLAIFEAVTSLLFLALTILFVRYLANGFVLENLSINIFFGGFLGLVNLYLFFMLIKFYLQNFVVLPFLLETEPITLRYIFKGLGVWFIRYGILYSVLLAMLQYLLGILGAVLGFSFVQMIFSMPITGQLIALPIFVVNLLWVMDITIQIRPELAKKRPPVDPWQVNR